MKFFKRAMLFMVVVSAILLIFPSYTFVKATGSFDVAAPSAYTAISSGEVLWTWDAMHLDGSPTALFDGSTVGTTDFYNPNYDEYDEPGGIPYEDRSAFPPSNATFVWVWMLAVVWCQIPRTFQMMAMSNLPNYTTYPTVWMTCPQLATCYQFNLTDWFESMGWMNSVNHTLSEYLGNLLRIFVIADDHAYNRAIYVDYVGLRYKWQYQNESSTSPGEEGWGGFGGAFGLPDTSALMGVVGFSGMIAVPAMSIWFFRQEGGSKIYAGIVALCAFVFCFALFLGVINGG